MSFEMQSEADILTRLKTELAALLNGQSSIEGTFNADMLTANSIEFEQAYAEMALMIQANFADTSWDEYLTMRAAEFGVVRKAATAAVVTLKLAGEVGSSVIAGSLFSTTQDVKFYTTAAATIGAWGTATVAATCGAVGAVGNVESGTIINIPYSIPGILSVTNEAAAHDGYDEETDAALLARYLLKVRTPATSGNEYHYKQWALSVPGVGQVKVQSLWNGKGTVKVIIIDSDNATASNMLIQSVADYIESVRPIGATVTITSPAPLEINIAADAVGAADAATVKAAVNSYFKSTGFNAQYVSIAQIGKILLSIDGISDYANLKLNGGTANITISDEQLPTCGTVTLNVIS